MLSKENEVSLVVKGHNTPANELRVMGKQWREQTTNSMTKTCVEIVQNDFGHMFGGLATSLRNKVKNICYNSKQISGFLI